MHFSRMSALPNRSCFKLGMSSIIFKLFCHRISWFLWHICCVIFCLFPLIEVWGNLHILSTYLVFERGSWSPDIKIKKKKSRKKNITWVTYFEIKKVVKEFKEHKDCQNSSPAKRRNRHKVCHKKKQSHLLLHHSCLSFQHWALCFGHCCPHHCAAGGSINTGQKKVAAVTESPESSCG